MREVKTAMRSPTLILGMILAIIFVAVGDAFLPQPLAKASYNTRTQLNEFLIGLFPDPDIDRLKPDRAKEIEEIEGSN